MYLPSPPSPPSPVPPPPLLPLPLPLQPPFHPILPPLLPHPISFTPFPLVLVLASLLIIPVCRQGGELLSESAIETIHGKRRLDKEARMASIKVCICRIGMQSIVHRLDFAPKYGQSEGHGPYIES